jgi:hypothetical protein
MLQLCITASLIYFELYQAIIRDTTIREQAGRGRKWQAVEDASVGRVRQDHSSQRESCRYSDRGRQKQRQGGR